MRLILSIFALLLTLLPNEKSFGEELSLENLISKVQKSYEGVSDLTASFEQETVIPDFKKSIKYKGIIFLKKKDKMKLAYTQPKKQEILINGKLMITYLPDEHQAISGLFSKEQESKLPLRLLSGEAILKNEFDIQKGLSHSPNLYPLLLKPLQKDSNVEKIEIEIDPATYLIKNLRLFQTNQNYSSFAFSGIRINTGIKEALFQFTPPEGTEVINPLGTMK